jgi:hypothetical protein
MTATRCSSVTDAYQTSADTRRAPQFNNTPFALMASLCAATSLGVAARNCHRSALIDLLASRRLCRCAAVSALSERQHVS